jgi:hypothetical protein
MAVHRLLNGVVCAADIMSPAQLHRACVSGAHRLLFNGSTAAAVTFIVAVSGAAEVHYQDHIHGPRVCSRFFLLTAMA